jgi:hypothetical protein
MQIATFGPDTTWPGMRITWNGAELVLEGHGPVAPQDVMYYDQQGWLVWSDSGTRAWVGAKSIAQVRAPKRTKGTSKESERWKSALIAAIGVLLAVNLVLLVIYAHVIHLL